MSTESVPPQAAPQPTPPSGSGHRTAPRVIALLTAALGVAVVVGTVATAAVPTVAAAAARDEERSVAVGGVSTVKIDVDAVMLTVVFDDVSEASLDVREFTRGSWTFERNGSTLRVATPRNSVLSWFGGGNGRATLTLPEELAGVDTDVMVAGGSVEASGDFGDLGLTLAAGRVAVRGTAETLTADVDAGRGEIDLSNVSTAALSTEAGELIARLGGTAPDTVTASISAGSIELTLPDEVYDVTTGVSAGGVDNRLRTQSGSPRTVDVRVEMGNALLTAD